MVDITEAIVLKARDLVATWNGEFLFVPIRSQLTYRGVWEEAYFDEMNSRIAEANIPIVDIDQALRATGEPLSCFPARDTESHFNPSGYALLASEIVRAGFAP